MNWVMAGVYAAVFTTAAFTAVYNFEKLWEKK